MKKVTLFKIAACAVVLIAAVIYTVSAFVGDDAMAFNSSGLCMTSVEDADSSVALTFDTTFGEDHTREILSILKEKGAKATFAVMGVWAEENPKLVKEMISDGHEVISHSMTHERYDDLGAEKAIEDAFAAKQLLKMDFGVDTNYIRLPYGSGSDEICTALIEGGYMPVGWSIDSQDWKNDGGDAIKSRVLNNIENGSIVVMQNNNPGTVEALPGIIDGIYDMSFDCVTISELGGKA